MKEMSNLDDVVISGISGVFPKSENVEEFKNNLLAGNDMISSTFERHNKKGLNVGLLKTIDQFDYSFFRMNNSHAKSMTFSAKILLEKTFEAILDAGYNPQEIKGKNIAVIGGVWDLNDEGDPAKDKKPETYTEFGGKMVFMLMNRISQWLDVHGPSYSVNTACSSSIYAIDDAIKAIQRGQCEGAIVCSSNFCLAPMEYSTSTPFLSPDGTSAPFDADANGYVRAEAVVVVFLQKRKHARRIYSTIIHSSTNSDGFQVNGTGFPSTKAQINLYQQFYQEINLDPRKISYIEAHGTGTRAGDTAEGTSIDEFFCTNRTSPLKVGSVKSNMGHAEAAAALCSIIKLIIAFETGTIPANLRYNKPNLDIKGFSNGHLEVVTKPIPSEGDYFALSSFGLGGANGHIVLQPHKKVQNKQRSSIDENIHWLVTASGRTEEAVDCILNSVEKNRNAEYIRLLHEIFKYGIQGHPYRGYIILQKNNLPKVSKKFFSGEERPIWFVFSGLGSQWPAMGKLLMEIPIFAQSIRKSHDALRSKDLDVIKIISNDDPQILDNILNIFVGITAIQIALVDVLSQMNIKPDGIIGHSVGEVACGYADGCLTAEQTILAAYYRGLVLMENGSINGTMAAVGESSQYGTEF
ncbi:fatty acid synthase-like [Planococcus citri]|uniref:fatty acid synthase-like n=1 Tax=Planococcus citri TaxID=170843 RepID=UPI0031FA2465